MRAGRRDGLVMLLILLTLTTGLVDAVSFVGLGRVFTANMTGNVVLLGFALAGDESLSVSSSLLALGAFLVGAAVGGRVGTAMAGRSRGSWLLVAAAVEIVLLLAAAIAARHVGLDAGDRSRAPIIALMALAMGARNATVRRLAVPDLKATVLTWTLTGLAADSWFAGGSNPRPVRRLGSVAALLGGATCGAAMVIHSGLALPLVTAAAVTLVITVTYAAGRPYGEPDVITP